MARGRKKENALSPAERLQAALVPNWEQPYKVPENWCWTKVGTISKVKGGKRLPKGRTFLDGKSAYPYIRVADFENSSICMDSVKYIDYDTHMLIKQYTISSADVYISIAGTIGKVGTVPEELDGANLTENAAKITGFTGIYQLYLVFFLESEFAQNQMREFTISTTQPKLALFRIEDILLPLPPFSEQMRIVARIKILFARLDEAKQKVQDMLDGFETRKATIMHKAFTGELTVQWRKEHGVGMKSWERLKLGEIGTLERGRSQHRPRNDPQLFGGPYPFIQTGDVASANVYITEHHQTLSEFGMEQSRMFTAGTLCITIAANIGDVAILSYDCCFPDSVVGFTPNRRSVSKFVYYMMSVLQKELEDNAPATAQKNINLKILNAVEINVPSVIEQNEIVRILDDILAKEQQAKEAAEKVLEQIDMTKKAILARAFRGELGTNDPSEESAVELLKQVL